MSETPPRRPARAARPKATPRAKPAAGPPPKPTAGPAPKPAAKPSAKPAAKPTAKPTGQPGSSVAALSVPDPGTTVAPAPRVVTPEELEIPPGLPELTFPTSAAHEFDEQAGARRRLRLRSEGIGAAVVLVLCVVLTIITSSPSVLALGAIALGALAVYELLVSNFE